VTSSNTAAVTAVLTGGAAAGGFQIGVQQLASADQVTQQSSLTAANADDTLQIQVGAGTPVSIAVSAGDTVATIAGKINATSNSQVYASVINNQLVLSGQVTGAANKTSVHRLRRDGRPPWRHPPNPWACSKWGQTPFGAVTGC
jgi:flagellar hook-associated protein 2